MLAGCRGMMQGVKSPVTVSGAPAAFYLGTLMRNPRGLNTTAVARDARRAARSRSAMFRLRLATLSRTVRTHALQDHVLAYLIRPSLRARASRVANRLRPRRSEAA